MLCFAALDFFKGDFILFCFSGVGTRCCMLHVTSVLGSRGGRRFSFCLWRRRVESQKMSFISNTLDPVSLFARGGFSVFFFRASFSSHSLKTIVEEGSFNHKTSEHHTGQLSQTRTPLRHSPTHILSLHPLFSLYRFARCIRRRKNKKKNKNFHSHAPRTNHEKKTVGGILFPRGYRCGGCGSSSSTGFVFTPGI